MNAADRRSLLTAALDGELTPTEQMAARRLVRESEEARLLHAKLQGDAARLRRLPVVPAPSGLAENILHAVRDRAPTPLPAVRRSTEKSPGSSFFIWVSFASAASILAAIGLASYLIFSAPTGDSGRPRNSGSHSDVARNGGASSGTLPPTDKPMALPLAPEKKPGGTGGDAVVRMPERTGSEPGPTPRVMGEELFSPTRDMPEIEAIHLDKIRVSRLISLRELPDDLELRKTLLVDLKKDELIRLDLFCHATPKALELVLARLATKGVKASTDAHVIDRNKKKQATEIVVFTESLTPAEVADVLLGLGIDDRKAEIASGAGHFDTLVVAPFLPVDLDKLGRLLGATNVMPKIPTAKAGPDSRKPLPDGTAQAVAASLNKMGGGTVPAGKSDKVAVVVAYSPMNAAPSTSKEIRQFLDRRGERKPDTKPLMLVLRTISK